MALSLLLILTDIRHSKTYNLALRSAAFVFTIGSCLVMSFLGLFTIWLIVFVCFAGSAHLLLFARGLKLEDDADYMVNRGSYRLMNLEAASADNE